MTDPWLDAEEAAARLGVKPATLYAYASRGQLRRRTGPDGRRSEYHPDDVADLAVRGRRARPGGSSDVVVPSAVTAITDDGPVYRGEPAVALAGAVSFEEVAARLWEVDHAGPWHARAALLRAARAGTPASALPPDRPAARLPVLVATAALADPLRHDLRDSSLARIGRELLSVLVDVPRTPEPEPGDRIAARLGALLTGAAPSAELVRLLDAALVLLADHELAASTLAVRVAASARCDPWAVVLTGLGVLSGPRHGAASRPLELALREVASGTDPAHALATRVTATGDVPGFGHPLYPQGDPRAERLLALLREGPLGEAAAPLRAVLEVAARDGLPPPNVDAALGGLTWAAGAPVGSAEVVFAVARIAGWLAHAREQYAEPDLLRPRAVYTGPAATERPG